MPPIREFEIFCGDCRDILPTLPRLADACICDPPYGLKFMGKGWDHGVPGVPYWKAVLNACKPGAHLLAFGGTRTFHRLTCAIEDAGWEIRDCIMWVYGSGFPKSLDISKAIDKAAGAVRLKFPNPLAKKQTASIATNDYGDYQATTHITPLPATEAAKQWDGWGTALKPAWEPIILARKPFKSTVADNVLKYGTGGINIDGCRVETEEIITNHSRGEESAISKGKYGDSAAQETHQTAGQQKGRFPANLIHDGSQEVLELFPNTKGVIRKPTGKGILNPETGWNNNSMTDTTVRGHNDSGSAARFFYCAKASKQDRDEGCESMPAVKSGMSNGAQLHGEGYDKGQDIGLNRVIQRRNHHPTVKPTALMRYLVKLVSRPGHTILDPFSGSGSTGKAAILEARQFLGIELQPEYVQIATARLSHAVKLHQESSAQHSAVTHH